MYVDKAHGDVLKKQNKLILSTFIINSYSILWHNCHDLLCCYVDMYICVAIVFM